MSLIRVHAGVTGEFEALTRQVLDGMYRRADPLARAAMVSTRWELWSTPTPYHYATVWPPAQPGERLIGRFDFDTVSISLFEEELRWHAGRTGRSLTDAVHDVAIHELEHRFKLDHLHETAAAIAAAQYAPAPGG